MVKQIQYMMKYVSLCHQLEATDSMGLYSNLFQRETFSLLLKILYIFVSFIFVQCYHSLHKHTFMTNGIFWVYSIDIKIVLTVNLAPQIMANLAINHLLPC